MADTLPSSIPAQSDHLAADAAKPGFDWQALLLWLAAGVLLVICARLASVSRTQEARVLETAREMLGRPFAGWMIPHTNGEIRLHKPPLAYWLTAGAFKAFRISTWTGRLPAAIAGWGLIGVTFVTARRLFHRGAALFAGAALLGCYSFFKFTLLAETDILATLFVTAGIYAALRAIDTPRAWHWQHAVAACMALAILSKGPPAAYIALFLIAMCALRKDWRPLKCFFASGAIATLLILALPWFIYVGKAEGFKQLTGDLLNSAEGGVGHSNFPHVYIPMFALSIAPWTAVWGVAIAAALRHVWRRLRPWQGMDASATLLLWGLIIALPLLGWGNKQPHYLLPLLPPTMILVGYAVRGAINGQGRFHDLSRVILAATAGLLAVLPAVPPVIARLKRDHGEIYSFDWLLCGVLIVVVSVAIWRARRDGWRGLAWSASLLAIALAVTTALEARAIERWPTETLAGEMLRVHPKATFIFRDSPSLSMCFLMGQNIPVFSDAEIAARAGDKNIVCLERLEHEPKNGPPPAFREEGRLGQDEQWLRVFVPEAR